MWVLSAIFSLLLCLLTSSRSLHLALRMFGVASAFSWCVVDVYTADRHT